MAGKLRSELPCWNHILGKRGEDCDTTCARYEAGEDGGNATGDGWGHGTSRGEHVVMHDYTNLRIITS